MSHKQVEGFTSKPNRHSNSQIGKANSQITPRICSETGVESQNSQLNTTICFTKTTRRNRVVGRFGRFGCFSREGYARPRGRDSHTDCVSPPVERIGQIGQIGQRRTAVWRFGFGSPQPNRSQLGAKRFGLGVV